MFDSIYEKILKTDGVIIDVRGNVGGATQIAYYILSHFTNESFKSENWKTPNNIAAHRALGDSIEWLKVEGYDVHPHKNKTIYTKPVNVVADESSFSGAEDFCVGFLTMKRGKLIGRKTAGSSGSPLMLSLPGGGMALICTKEDFFPDGRAFIGTGISPDIEVEVTIKDIIENRDPILDAAITDILNR
jgi:carboxyl-terminal processing protease